jgi:uncharacterized membrane protein YGL010W
MKTTSHKKQKKRHKSKGKKIVLWMLWFGFMLAAGTQICTLQEKLGMLHSQPAIEYYAEVHQSFWNSTIHTIFMPLCMFGMFLWIPALFRLNYKAAATLRMSICCLYLGSYIVIDYFVCVLVFCWYLSPFLASHILYKQHSVKHKTRLLFIGCGCSVVSLMIQEYVGHYLGGDASSRAEGVVNAIVYSPYFSISHLLDRFHV